MPSPPLPPRIALTDDPPVVQLHAPKRGRRAKGADLDFPPGEAPTGGQTFTNWLALGVFVLMMALAGMVWKWSKATEQTEAAARQAATAWSFSDGVLEDLSKAREQAAKLAGERETLIRVLGDAQKQQASLRSEFTSWQQKHQQVVASSERALAQLSQYGQTLENNLGTAQAQLAATGQTLEQERTTAEQERNDSEQQIAQLGNEKTKAQLEAEDQARQKLAAERSAIMLDQAAKGLDNDNARLQTEISRLRSTIGALETENTAEQLRNATLIGDISRQRDKISSLESRLQAAERERDKERDKAKQQQH